MTIQGKWSCDKSELNILKTPIPLLYKKNIHVQVGPHTNKFDRRAKSNASRAVGRTVISNTVIKIN